MHIKIENLSKSFNNHKILDNLSLDVKEGSSLVILGPSGAGKSVLLKTIVGLMRSDQGKILVDSLELTGAGGKRQTAFLQQCGYLFQSGALFDFLTIAENIAFPLNHLKQLTVAAKKEIIMQKLQEVGLPARVLNFYPKELSGGMQKRAALARAICTDPKVIFFDEPTTGLDPMMSNVINELILDVGKRLNATTITITHDIASANTIASDVAFLFQGKIAWQGTKQEMQQSNDPYLLQFLRGETRGPIELG